MVYTCYVTGCRTGYKPKKDEKIPLFQFPTDKVMREKWIRAVPRKNFKITCNSKVCALHFDTSDFVTISTDKRNSRRDSDALIRTRLKPTAIPHIFPNLPQYLSKKKFLRSTIASTSTARQGLENARIQSCNSNLFDCEQFDSFVSFKSKIADETLPSGYIVVSNSNSMLFHYIACQENFQDAPKLLSSVVVTEDLTVKPFVLSIPLPSSSFCHIVSGTKLSNTSELLNILALCKSLSQMDSSISSKVFMSTAIKCLEIFLSTSLNENNLDQNEQFLLQFILEQLQLISISKTGRRYSISMLKTCFFMAVNQHMSL